MSELLKTKPRIVVIGVGGAGGNAVNNMVAANLTGVHFVAANTDLQALANSRAEHKIQLGVSLTEGLGAGSKPEIGEAAAEEALDDIRAQICNAHMVFIAAGMGGGTGTGAAYVIARASKELGILTIAVVTKPFQFEGSLRMRNAEAGIEALTQYVDTLLVIPNENLFRVATDRTTFAEAFVVADQVLYSGIACLVDLIVEEGLINLDLADVKSVLTGMGAAMLGMGEASGEQRAIVAAEEAIVNPLLDDVTLKGAKSLLLSIRGGRDLTLWEVDETANRVRQEVDQDANIIVGATLDESLSDQIRVSIVASGMPLAVGPQPAYDPAVPSWSPRTRHIQTSVATPERFGRRLTEAITERDLQGKAKPIQKGRARGRNIAREPALSARKKALA
jgi:cell division protein FtsZ